MKVQIIKARKLRIYPSKVQAAHIDTTLDSCRFAYNHMLSRNNKVYERRGEHLSYNDMQNLLPQMKKYLPWLAEADSQALKYACRQVDNAFRNFFKKQAGYPKFKSKRRGIQSYTTTKSTAIHYEPGRVKLPCLGWIKMPDKRELNGSICYATVKREYGKYYVSITYKTEIDIEPVKINKDNVVGLDYKSDGLYASSDDEIAGMPHFYRLAQEKLAWEQHKLSRKIGAQKGEKQSNNYKKQQKKLQKKAQKVANQRKDYLHKQSTAIAKRYDAVCVEYLNMRSLSNKGFGNGKATMDNGYGMFLNMLEYKLNWQGKKLIRIDKWYPSSQLCSCCGYRQPMPVGVGAYRCPSCGAVIDRDINAAMNIRAEGLRMI